MNGYYSISMHNGYIIIRLTPNWRRKLGAIYAQQTKEMKKYNDTELFFNNKYNELNIKYDYKLKQAIIKETYSITIDKNLIENNDKIKLLYNVLYLDKVILEHKSLEKETIKENFLTVENLFNERINK